MGASESEGSDPDLSEVDTVWLGNEDVSGEAFVQALNTVQDVQESMQDLQQGLEDLSTGLDREDAVALIYGRNYDISKTQAKAAFDVMDVLIQAPPEDIAPRLMADKTSDLTIAEAAKVWDDVVELAEKYGTTEANDD
jgi:hypothetical protein